MAVVFHNERANWPEGPVIDENIVQITYREEIKGHQHRERKVKQPHPYSIAAWPNNRNGSKPDGLLNGNDGWKADISLSDAMSISV